MSNAAEVVRHSLYQDAPPTTALAAYRALVLILLADLDNAETLPNPVEEVIRQLNSYTGSGEPGGHSDPAVRDFSSATEALRARFAQGQA